MKYIFAYILTLVTFLIIDFLWLGLISRNFYSENLGFLLADNVNFFAAFIFYLLFVLGIIIFVVYPASKVNSLKQALLLGMLFGLVTYATYDLTNQATVKDWPLKVTLVDLAWGITVSSITAVSGYFYFRKLGLGSK